MVPSSQTTTATKPLPLPSSPTILSLSLECRGKCKILRSLHSQLFFPRLLEVETQQRNARERRDVTAVARGGGQRRNAECLIKAVRMSGEVTNWLSAALCSTLYPLSPPKKKKKRQPYAHVCPFLCFIDFTRAHAFDTPVKKNGEAGGRRCRSAIYSPYFSDQVCQACVSLFFIF